MSALPVDPVTLNNDEFHDTVYAYLSGAIQASALQAYLNTCSSSLPDLETIIDKVNAVVDARQGLASYLGTHYPTG